MLKIKFSNCVDVKCQDSGVPLQSPGSFVAVTVLSLWSHHHTDQHTQILERLKVCFNFVNRVHSSAFFSPFSSISRFIVSTQTWNWSQSAHLAPRWKSKAGYFQTVRLSCFKSLEESRKNTHFIEINSQPLSPFIWSKIMTESICAFRTKEDLNSKSALLPYQRTVRSKDNVCSRQGCQMWHFCLYTWEKQNCHRQHWSPSSTVSTAHGLLGGPTGTDTMSSLPSIGVVSGNERCKMQMSKSPVFCLSALTG